MFDTAAGVAYRVSINVSAMLATVRDGSYATLIKVCIGIDERWVLGK
jgi:hypothetical protein